MYAAFEEARTYLTALHPDKNFTPSQELKERKANLRELIKPQKSTIQEIGDQEKELQIASENVDAILDQQPVQEQKKSHLSRSSSISKGFLHNSFSRSP